MPKRNKLLFISILVAPLLLLISGLISNQTILDQLLVDVNRGELILENYPPAKDGSYVSDRYTECVAITMGIHSNRDQFFLDGLKGEFVGNCNDLAIALQMPSASVDVIDKSFNLWKKNFGWDGVLSSREIKDKNTYREMILGGELSFFRIFDEFVSFLNSPPTLESRLKYTEESASEPHPYSRFWHGYQIITRPSIAIGGVALLRIVTGGIFLWSVLLVCIFLQKKYTIGIAVIFGILFLLSLDTREILSNSIHAIGMASMLISALYAAQLNSAEKKLMCGFWGMYFSFLLNIQVGLLMVFWLSCDLYALKSRSLIEFKKSMQSAIFWCSGVVLSFIYKFLISLLVLNHKEVTSIFLSAIENRSWGNHHGLNDLTYDFLAMIVLNLRFWFFEGWRCYTLILFCFFATSFQIVHMKFYKNYLVFDLICILLVLLSLFGILNHSLLHGLFVWRVLPTLAVVLFVSAIIAITDKNTHTHIKNSY